MPRNHSEENQPTMKVLEVREFSLRPAVNRKCFFFRLPVEIRLQIYEYCLIEPSLWDKRHQPTCSQSPRNTIKSEVPLFADVFDKFDEDGRSFSSSSTYSNLFYDSCGVRQGLSLLLANRQIHQEAAPIFWANHVFCWPTGRRPWSAEHGPRAEYLAMIRHISVIPNIEADWDWTRLSSPQPNVATVLRFWADLHYCPELRSLEVPAEYITDCIDFVSRSKRDSATGRDIEHLSEIEGSSDSEDLPVSERRFFKYLTSVKLLGLREEQIEGRDRYMHSVYLRFEKTWKVKKLRTVEMCERAGTKMEKLGNCVGYHALDMLKAALVGRPWESLTTPGRPSILSPVTGHNGKLRMKTCHGKEYTLRVYGMPLSAEELEANEGPRRLEAEVAEYERQKKRDHINMLKMKARERRQAKMRHAAFKGGRHARNLCMSEVLEAPTELGEEWEDGDREESEEYGRMMELAKELSLAEDLNFEDNADSLEDDIRLAKELSLAEQLSLETT